MEHALAGVAMGERRPRAALEEPTLFALTDKEPKYLGERLIDVDLADRILRLWSQVLSFPDAPADGPAASPMRIPVPARTANSTRRSVGSANCIVC